MRDACLECARAHRLPFGAKHTRQRVRLRSALCFIVVFVTNLAKARHLSSSGELATRYAFFNATVYCHSSNLQSVPVESSWHAFRSLFKLNATRKEKSKQEAHMRYCICPAEITNNVSGALMPCCSAAVSSSICLGCSISAWPCNARHHAEGLSSTRISSNSSMKQPEAAAAAVVPSGVGTDALQLCSKALKNLILCWHGLAHSPYISVRSSTKVKRG